MAVRVDQQATEALAESSLAPELRTTKISLRVVSDPAPDDPGVCPCDAYFKLNTDNLRHQTHRLARCWEITRTDGTTYRFTDHNRKLTVAQKESAGVVFSPIQGATATAQSRVGGLQAGTYEIFGVTGSIAFGDLVGGLFSGASITELVVDWKYPFAGAYRCQTHFVKRISFDGEKWEAELVNQRGKLEKPLGTLYSRACRFKLYESGTCNLSADPWTLTGTVLGVDADEPYRKFTTLLVAGGNTSDIINSSSFFKFGNVTWDTGSNAGLSMEIREFLNGSIADWELYLDMPFQIAVSDTFTATAGCDHTSVHCKEKFNNYANFGGQPFMPGEDATLRGPGITIESIIFNLITRGIDFLT